MDGRRNARTENETETKRRLSKGTDDERRTAVEEEVAETIDRNGQLRPVAVAFYTLLVGFVSDAVSCTIATSFSILNSSLSLSLFRSLSCLSLHSFFRVFHRRRHHHHRRPGSMCTPWSRRLSIGSSFFCASTFPVIIKWFQVNVYLTPRRA